jgi:hypothetical protein
VPKDADDRVNHISVEVKEARNAPARVVPAQLHVEATPRPMFAHAYQLIDEGNGDGLVSAARSSSCRSSSRTPVPVRRTRPPCCCATRPVTA